MFILHRNMVKRYKKSDPIRLQLHWCINRRGVQKHRVPTAIHWKKEKPILNSLLKKKVRTKKSCRRKKRGFFFPFTVGIVMRRWITQTQRREHPPNLIPFENGPLLQNKGRYRLRSEKNYDVAKRRCLN